MRKYLIPESGNFYKANLHCHSNFSDGHLSPETLKGAYMAHGYSIIAYTDHDLLLDRSDLSDDRFLALNAMELEVSENKELAEAEGRIRKTCHMCIIALDPTNITQVCYHREKYLGKNAKTHRHELKVDESLPDYTRVYSTYGVSDMMNISRNAGFFVTYNHPAWSCETSEEYCHYDGMHAMEICNFSCCVNGYEDYNPRAYDEMLRSGKRIYCVGTDDNHNGKPLTSPLNDSFGAYTMIKAEALEYKAVTDALVAGNFYASQGPEIKDLWFEDGKVYISSSKASRIYMNSGKRHAVCHTAKSGEYLTEAFFDIKEDDIYVRFTVEDENGRHANTNAYFLDELFS